MAPRRHHLRRHRRATVAVVHHAIAATPASRADRRSARHRRDARQQRGGVLRGSDRFCRQAWIRFFSMNRHQRTVWRKRRGRGGARLLGRLLHEDWAGLVVDHVPVCGRRVSMTWRTLRRRNAPPPVAPLEDVDGLERRRLALGRLVARDPRRRASQDLCGNPNFTARSMRRLLDGVAMPVRRRSTEPGRPRHHREMT
jgi:hypothetical protein